MGSKVKGIRDEHYFGLSPGEKDLGGAQFRGMGGLVFGILYASLY